MLRKNKKCRLSEEERMENNKVVKGILIFFAIILAALILKTCSKIFLPLVLALFIFILINPLMGKLDKLHVPLGVSISLVLVAVCALLLVVVYILISIMNQVLNELPTYINRVAYFDERVSSVIREGFNLTELQFPGVIKSLNIDWVGYLKNFATSFSTKTFSIFKSIGMIILYLLFLLLERRLIFPKVSAIFKESPEDVTVIVAKIGKETSRYLSIKVLISLITGTLFALVAICTGLDFPFLWGIATFLLNFIPTIGSIVITIAITLFAAIQFLPSWGGLITVFVCCFIIQMVLGNIIEPRLQGDRLDLSPLVILIMLPIWNYIWGVTGMLLAIPMTSILKAICNNMPSLKKFSIFLSAGGALKKKG